MQNIKEVNWFRLIVFIGLSVATSLAVFYNDEVLSRGELFTIVVQSLITAFSYLQCPEATQNFLRRKRNVGKTGQR